MSEQKRSRPSSLLGALPACLLVVVALWEVCATRRDATSVPDDEAWERAARIVRAAFRPGDLIVFAPSWNDPVGRLHLGELMPLESVARDDAAPYARIWELSIRGARAPEVAGLTAVEERPDAVTVRRYEQKPAVIAGDLRDHAVAPASVQLAEVGFAPHRCLLVTPAAKQPIAMTFPAMSLGAELVGYVGLADVFSRRDLREPGHLAIAVDGVEVARVTAGVDDGWVRFSAPVAAPKRSSSGVITVTASADVPQRNLCFSITTRQ